MNLAGSSSRELLDGIERPDSSKAKSTGALGLHSAWQTIARAYTADYAVLIILAVITLTCEGAKPFSKVRHKRLSHLAFKIYI